MKVALMQPYFLPYLGYFQLISAVDVFVFYDDVQFIKNGWINRNRILVNDDASYITLPVERGHLRDNINQRHFVSYQDACVRILSQVEGAYRKAPFFREIRSLLGTMFQLGGDNVAEALSRQLMALSRYLGISREFRISSQLDKNDTGLDGQDRVIRICRARGATDYYNSIGGLSLYDSSAFAQCGLKLAFIRSRVSEYGQFRGAFVPNLSIVDALMFNSPEQISAMLKEWDLVEQCGNFKAESR